MNATLLLSHFDLTKSNSYSIEITSNGQTKSYPIVVYSQEVANVYQDGEKLTPSAEGYYVIDKTKKADSNGLHWITFDSAEDRISSGYPILALTVKFEDFGGASAGIVSQSLSPYNYTFGYRYGSDTWVYFDNKYVTAEHPEGQAYAAAITLSNGAPYGYGYLKIYDKASGKLVLDYYELKYTDSAGTHGNWSSYTNSLELGKEYIIEIDASKTGDISFSGIENAVITDIEWKMKDAVTVKFNKSSLDMKAYGQETISAVASDGSEVTYSVDDSSILAISGNKIIALKEGKATITAVSGTSKATLKVTVSAADKDPQISIECDNEIMKTVSSGISVTLSSGNDIIPSEYYTLAYTTDSNIIEISNGSIKTNETGEVTITATIVIGGKTFTQSKKISVIEYSEDNETVAKLYQDGSEIKKNKDGFYAVDKTKDADSSGRRWINVNNEMSGKYQYLIMRVKFTSFANLNAGIVNPSVSLYNYHFGFVYDEGEFFVDNLYVSGGFGGGISPNGDATAPCYFAIYNTDGSIVVDSLTKSGWTSYFNLELNKEYVFVFDVSGLGSSFKLAGFDDAIIYELRWSKTTK